MQENCIKVDDFCSFLKIIFTKSVNFSQGCSIIYIYI